MNEVVVLMYEDRTKYLLHIFESVEVVRLFVREFYPSFQEIPVASDSDIAATWAEGTDRLLAIPMEVKR